MPTHLDACRWPELAPPFSGALREAVAYLLERYEATAILACGSILRGDADATSDLDLYVLHRAPFRQRLQRYFSGVPAEMFVNPPWAIPDYFSAEAGHERPPATLHMLATGFEVLSEEPALPELRAEARRLLESPPAQPAAAANYARYGAALLLEDALDVAAREPEAAQALAAQAVVACLEHAFRGAGRFVPRRKDWFRVLEEIDPALCRLAEAYYREAAPAQRLQVAAEIADRALGARGFYEWESEALPCPEPSG